MKNALKILVLVTSTTMFMCCHSNPHNSFGGPSSHPKDTAAKKNAIPVAQVHVLIKHAYDLPWCFACWQC